MFLLFAAPEPANAAGKLAAFCGVTAISAAQAKKLTNVSITPRTLHACAFLWGAARPGRRSVHDEPSSGERSMPVQAASKPVARPRQQELQLGRIRATASNPTLGSVTGTIEEMSPTDIRIYSEEQLPIGSLVNIRLAPEGWDCQFEANGVVHRSEILADGADMGIFLAEPLAEELISACWLEMRRELRYSVVWAAWARPESQKKILAATILNYSYSGVQIRLPYQPQAGERITLLTDSPIATATVRWAAPYGPNQFFCGCQMAKSDGLKLALRVQLSTHA
jgi:hypothetical protein